MARAAIFLVLAVFLDSGCATTASLPRTKTFADLSRVLEPGERVSIVGVDGRRTVGQVEKVSVAPDTSITLQTAGGQREIWKSDVAEIRRSERRPLGGLAEGSFGVGGSSAYACLRGIGGLCPFVPGLSVVGAVVGLVTGAMKLERAVYAPSASRDARSNEVAATAAVMPGTFGNLRVRSVKANGAFAEEGGRLRLDAGTKRLLVESTNRSLSLAMEDVRRVVVDRGPGEDWCYIEYREQGSPIGTGVPLLLAVPDETSTRLVEELAAVLGSRVVAPMFGEATERIELRKWLEVKLRHAVGGSFAEPAAGAPISAKATITVVWRSLGIATFPKSHSPQMKLYANGSVIAVNAPGTYSVVHIEPGDYLLASIPESTSTPRHATGIRIRLEPGEAYFFEEEPGDLALRTRGTIDGTLVQRSREVVMYEIAAAEQMTFEPLAGQ